MFTPRVSILAQEQERPFSAELVNQAFLEDTDVDRFINDMVVEHGLDPTTLRRDFALTSPNKAVLRAITPASRIEQRSWVRYRERFVNTRRISKGQLFIASHTDDLTQAENRYGVPKEIIAAIIGVETEYGQNPGRFTVFEALATLAFRYPPRSTFFRSELEQFLLLARENDMDDLMVKGSYAGAIGIPQFMPSSVRRYGVDFNHDGRIDLQGSSSDTIGSIASFLSAHGWLRGEPIALPIRIDASQARPLIEEGIRPVHTLMELKDRGVILPNHWADLGASWEKKAALIDLVSPEAPTQYWLGFDNFFVITRYNRSTFYAMSVFQLAEALRNNGKINKRIETHLPLKSPVRTSIPKTRSNSRAKHHAA